MAHETIIDISFQRFIDKWFKMSKTELCLINVSVYYEASMAKDPFRLIKKGLREIDVLLTLPAAINDKSIINLVEPAVVFFDEKVFEEYGGSYDKNQCHLIPKSTIWAVMYLWKLTCPDETVYYTYKSVEEINSHTILKMPGMEGTFGIPTNGHG